MKTTYLTTALAVIASSLSWGQYTTAWPSTTTPNTTAAGYVGIGTKATSTATTNPSFDLHVHGTANYTGPANPPLSGPMYGSTARIGLTTGTTGSGRFDGLLMRLSDNDFSITNQEASGNIALAVTGAVFGLVTNDGGRAFIGSSSINGANFGKFNCVTVNDNGMFIRTISSGKYGLGILSNSATDNAIQVIGTSYGVLPTFTVKATGATEIHTSSTNAADKLLLVRNVAQDKKLLQLTNDGILRAREIIVDAQNWADYVFEPSYKLRSLDEVRSFIAENKHLPNVPSTSKVNENGVNLAKTDAILLEKIEELTLYLLQQDEKMKQMQAELEALKREQSDK
nr:hypothetical protein [uncultured Fluviicola sp.]